MNITDVEARERERTDRLPRMAEARDETREGSPYLDRVHVGVPVRTVI